MSIWSELGISPTKNVREIKKAYAAKSKLVHPEEHPEEFQKLHDAYRAALDIANSDVSFSAPVTEQESVKIVTAPIEEQKTAETIIPPIKEKDNSFDFSKIAKEHKTDEETEIETEQNFNFNDAIQRNSLRHDNEIMEKTETVIKNANALYNHKTIDKELDWLKIFDENMIGEIKYEPIFLEELYRFLKSHKVNERLANAIYILYNIRDVKIDYLDQGRFEDIYQLIIKERMRIYDSLLDRIKLCWTVIFVIVCLSFIFLANEMWIAIIIIMLFAMLILLKISSLRKRKKNFYE